MISSKYIYNTPPFIDFHTHREVCPDDVIEVVSNHPTKKREARFYTIGYHPWWTDNPLQTHELNELAFHYQNVPTCLGLGEFGFDQLKGPSLEVQEEIFYQQIEIANGIQAPVVIHCVRAFDRLLKVRRKFSGTNWVVHGFVRNKILAKQLLDQGLYLSLAPNDRMHGTFTEMLKFVPLDRIFLETDSDQRLSVMERYRIFASLRAMDIMSLRERLFFNFIHFYSAKWQHLTGLNEPNY